MAADKKQKKAMESKSSDLLAAKDFVIVQNDYRREIKIGDDLSDIPELYIQNLITEGVIVQGKGK